MGAGRIELPDAWRMHLLRCDRCRSEWEAYELLEQAIASWNAEPLDVDLVDRVMSDVAAHAVAREVSPQFERRNGQSNVLSAPVEPRPQLVGMPHAEHSGSMTSSRARSWTIVMTVAAVLLIVAIPALRNRSTDPHDAAPIAASDAPQPVPLPHTVTPDPVPPHAAPTDDAAIATLVREAGSAYASLASDVVLALRDAAILVPSAGLPAVPTGWPSPTTGPAELWPGELPADLQPIGRDVENALDFLWRVVPDEPAPAT